MPRSQLHGPDLQFGFVPPNVIVEAGGTVEDKDSSEDSEEDKDGLGDDKDDLDDDKNDADTNNVNDFMHDGEVQSLTHSTNSLFCTNNSLMKKKKHAHPISPSQSTDDGATLPPSCMKKQNSAILPPPHVTKKICVHPVSQSQPENDSDILSCPQCADNSHARSVPSMDSNIPSPPRHREAANNPGRGNNYARSWDQLVESSPNNASSVVDESSANKEDKVVDSPKRWHSANKVVSQTIGFYPYSRKDILEASKKKSQLGLVMDGAASNCKTFIEKTVDDIGVDDSYWDRYKHDMAIILWDDHATMWSEMKKAAQSITATKFDILPSDIDNDNKFEDYVSQQVTELLDGGYFLQNGVNEQVG
ncbi:uncharacterized protein EDB91DRAFT_1087781 [Suillus paluster]|uniref:uncharacterized protein n=1 Tax=Suillus paluster TaxID=48578 RepID=UPI001B87F968|nr:uncharacterized protein EDB91DRAFT_1087781 [Suillus paluster]KAG1723539.1 hypothetical protein EDB91DRAFT_1087781 [Suillus paluster]